MGGIHCLQPSRCPSPPHWQSLPLPLLSLLFPLPFLIPFLPSLCPPRSPPPSCIASSFTPSPRLSLSLYIHTLSFVTLSSIVFSFFFYPITRFLALHYSFSFYFIFTFFRTLLPFFFTPTYVYFFFFILPSPFRLVLPSFNPPSPSISFLTHHSFVFSCISS